MGIIQNEKGTQKGNRGGVRAGENYRVTKETEGHLNSAVYRGLFRNSVRSRQATSGSR